MREEAEALEEWQREVARIEELRLQDLVEHVIDASGTMSEVETESQLIDCLLPADKISMKTNSIETEEFQQIRRLVLFFLKEIISSISGIVYSRKYKNNRDVMNNN